MKQNILIIGHISAGKTALIEAMLTNQALNHVISTTEVIKGVDLRNVPIPIIEREGISLLITGFPEIPFIEPHTKKPWLVKTSEYRGKKGLGSENTTVRRIFRILEK